MAKVKIVKHSFLFMLLISSVLLTSCTTISNWFYEEEEIEIRRLKPIEAQFIPTEIWSADLGDGIGQFYSKLRPAVAYDKVFAANRQGRVNAYDQVTGKKLWSKNFAIYDNEGLTSGVSNLFSSGLSAKIAGGLSVAYETVFFGTENHNG
jgi:outer membrane protein assembly factor BamB